MKVSVSEAEANGVVTILAITESWQEACREMAKERKPFKVEGIHSRKDHAFCEDFCQGYGYKFSMNKRLATFIPDW